MPPINLRKGQLVRWSGKNMANSEREILRQWPELWEIKSLGVPMAGRHRNVKCAFVFPQGVAKLARWVPEDWIHFVQG